MYKLGCYDIIFLVTVFCFLYFEEEIHCCICCISKALILYSCHVWQMQAAVCNSCLSVVVTMEIFFVHLVHRASVGRNDLFGGSLGLL